jgi:hypothetical protein
MLNLGLKLGVNVVSQISDSEMHQSLSAFKRKRPFKVAIDEAKSFKIAQNKHT